MKAADHEILPDHQLPLDSFRGMLDRNGRPVEVLCLYEYDCFQLS
jgi:hypothetical protein